MRLHKYAVAFASACTFATTLAAPVEGPQVAEHVKRRSPAISTGISPSQFRDAGSKTKYFHEPGGDDILGHYDVRYFHGAVDYDERTDTLHHMMRAYLDFFRERGLETWIAHGTLLGWWWNGKILPWDWDIDTQVSGETLNFMAKNLNRTLHTYNATGEPGVSREYLLDVNPWSWERDRGDGMNIIDARWIDTRNGLYIDITGLSETEPDKQPGIWSCKNFHHYKTKDLYPMRESMYEGVPAQIPYAYDKILLEEYHEKALVLTDYEGHQWNQKERLWVKKAGQLLKEVKHLKTPVSSKKARKRALLDQIIPGS